MITIVRSWEMSIIHFNSFFSFLNPLSFLSLLAFPICKSSVFIFLFSSIIFYSLSLPWISCSPIPLENISLSPVYLFSIPFSTLIGLYLIIAFWFWFYPLDSTPKYWIYESYILSLFCFLYTCLHSTRWLLLNSWFYISPMHQRAINAYLIMASPQNLFGVHCVLLSTCMFIAISNRTLSCIVCFKVTSPVFSHGNNHQHQSPR